jgi:ABC-type sugar transport system, permease component
VLPVAANAWYIIIARTYFMTLPDSIEESARIDGCNNFKILLSIILPISMPIIAVIVLYSAVYHWNAYFNAMLFVTNPKKQPIQLYLARVIISNQMSAIMQGMADNKEKESYIQHLKYAIIIITILPIMCVYPFLQKYFVKGLLLGSVKG